MGKNFFERIADCITGGPENGPGKRHVRETGNPSGDNGIDKRGKLSAAILARLKENYLGQRISFDDKALSVWIQDDLFYHAVMESDFKQELMTKLNFELGFSFGAIDIRSGNVPEGPAPTEVFPHVLLRISAIDTDTVTRTARIEPVDGQGSTVEAYYLLDSRKIRELPEARYNVGIGKHPVMPDGSHRENQIAIDDDPNSPQFSKNRYVSRAHACITFSEEYGFLLNVEYGGTRAGQKRTCINRGGDLVELNNTLIPEPLKNGDHIILSKYVHLLFREI